MTSVLAFVGWLTLGVALLFIGGYALAGVRTGLTFAAVGLATGLFRW